MAEPGSTTRRMGDPGTVTQIGAGRAPANQPATGSPGQDWASATAQATQAAAAPGQQQGTPGINQPGDSYLDRLGRMYGPGGVLGQGFSGLGSWIQGALKGGQSGAPPAEAAGPKAPTFVPPPPPPPIPEDPRDGPEVKQAKAQAQAANEAQHVLVVALEAARFLVNQAKAAGKPVPPPDTDTSPEAQQLREAAAILQNWGNKDTPFGANQLKVWEDQERKATALARAQGDQQTATGPGKSGRPGVGQTTTTGDNQTWVMGEDGQWAPLGPPKKPGVTVSTGRDGSLRVVDDDGQLVNEIPVPNDGNPVVLSGSDGPELLIYDPADGSMWWQPNRAFLNTPTQVNAAAKDKWIVRQDRSTGKLIADENPAYNPRESDTVLVSSTGRSIRLDETGKLVSQTDTLTPEEREVYDKRARAESERAVTGAETDRFKLEQDKKDAEEWQRVEDAINNGATPSQVRTLVLQAAKNVTDYVNLMKAESEQATQLETGRHNLALEQDALRLRRTAEAGEARQGAESYGRYGLATAPFQTALLGSLSQVADPTKVAGTMNVAPGVFQPVADTYQKHQQELADKARTQQGLTDRLGQITSGQDKDKPFDLYKPPGAQPAAGPASPAPTSGAPGGSYGTSNPAAQPSPQPPGGAPAAAQAGPKQVDENRAAVDLGNGQARTYYTDGSYEDWAIPQTGQPGGSLPGQLPGETEQQRLDRFYNLPAQASEGGGVYGGGGRQSQQQQERQQERRRRMPVKGKHAIALGGGWGRTQYDDGSFEDWHVEDGPSWEGVGGGGAGYWGEHPATYGTYGWEHGTGGGGGSIWQMAPAASVDVGWGAQRALQQPDPPRYPDRAPAGMAGGFAGPSPATGGRGGGGGDDAPPDALFGGAGEYTTQADEDARAAQNAQAAADAQDERRRQAALAWARGQITSKQYNQLCEQFAENAYGTGYGTPSMGQYPSAVAGAAGLGADPNREARAGDFVFFKPDRSNNQYGHVGLATDQPGRFVSATAGGVREDSYTDDPYWKGLYSGSAAPRGDWAGRPQDAGGGQGGGPRGGRGGGGAYGQGTGSTGASTFATDAPSTVPGAGVAGQRGIQAMAPMWDAATPAPFISSGVSGPSGAAGQGTLYGPGAGGKLAQIGQGGGQGSGRGGMRPGTGPPTTGYYGGPAMPQAMSPLQRLLQQTGVVPLSAGRAAGSPGTV